MGPVGSRAVTRMLAMAFAVLVAGCSSGNNWFNGVSLLGPQAAPPLSPEEEASEDQKCRTDGYELNTPAYQYCRGELAKQRAIAAVATTPQSVPPMSAHR
jgi:hypothetical protein